MQAKRIPLSWPVRWRRIRSQAIPVFAFLSALLASGWLWQSHGGAVHGVGEVDALRVDVTSPTAGLVISLPSQTRGQWTVFDHVKAGDIIARIDDQQLEASKSLLRREVDELLQQLLELQVKHEAAEEAEAGDIVRRAWEFEQSRLESLAQKVAAAHEAVAPQDGNMIAAPPELPASVAVETRDDLVRLREARRGLDLRWEELSLRTGLLEIPAPISGTLVNVYCWPGQIVHPGGLIATIAADHGQHIVGYIPEDNSIQPKIGMRVTLRSRVARSPHVTSEVEEVGQQIERIPSHQRAMATVPQWGLPVRIKMPKEASLRPGSLVDIVFHRPEAP